MKILVLDEWLPSIQNSGKSIRTFQLLAPLAKKHEIVYLVNQDLIGQESGGQTDQLRKMRDAGFEVVFTPRPKVYDSIPSILLGAIPALFDPLPISVRRHFSKIYAEKIQRLVSERKFDLMHIEWSHYAVYGPFAESLPQFVCTHNVEYLSWTRFVKATGNPIKKLLGLHEARKMFRFEKNAYRKVDYLSVVSEDDGRLLQNKFGINEFCVVPNGVAIAPYDEIPNEPIPNRLVYCGSMDAFINEDAVRYFIKDIFPLILKQKPDASFCVIGRNPPESLLSLQNDRIIFTGGIDDVRIPLKQGMVEVVPLRIAGGTRLKILEAFAAKIPVVSTSIGAEGLDVEHGKNILLADTPKEFADRCIDMMNDPPLRSRLAEDGRRIVDEQYDWSRISPLVETAWHKTIELFGQKQKNPKGI